MKNKILNSLLSEKGITLLMTIFVLGGVLAISSAIANTVIIQLKISGAAEDSTIAFFAADAGVECRLWYIRQGAAGDDCLSITNLANAASYEIKTGFETNPLKSVGSYRATKRGIEATY